MSMLRAGRGSVHSAGGRGVCSEIVRLSELSYEVALLESVCVCVREHESVRASVDQDEIACDLSSRKRKVADW